MRQEELSREFGLRIKALRNRLGLKQKEFAASIEMSGSYLSEIEGGKASPGFDFFYKLTKHYKLNPLYLMHGEGKIFLDGHGEKEEVVEKEKEEGAGIKAGHYVDRDGDAKLRELLWYMERSHLVRYSVLEFFIRYLMKNREVIEEEIGTPYEGRVKGDDVFLPDTFYSAF